MIELTPKIIKDIIRLRFELKCSTGDIIREYPGVTKKQIQSVIRKYVVENTNPSEKKDVAKGGSNASDSVA